MFDKIRESVQKNTLFIGPTSAIGDKAVDRRLMLRVSICYLRHKRAIKTRRKLDRIMYICTLRVIRSRRRQKTRSALIYILKVRSARERGTGSDVPVQSFKYTGDKSLSWVIAEYAHSPYRRWLGARGGRALPTRRSTLLSRFLGGIWLLGKFFFFCLFTPNDCLRTRIVFTYRGIDKF